MEGGRGRERGWGEHMCTTFFPVQKGRTSEEGIDEGRQRNNVK